MPNPEHPSNPPDSDPKSTRSGPSGGESGPTAHPNAFTSDFIHRFDQEEAPPHTFAALGGGPWQVRPTEETGKTGTKIPPSKRPDWGCYAEGEPEPVARAQDRSLALLLAAAFPAAASPWRFQIDRSSSNPVVLLDRGTPAAALRWADEELVAAVNVLAALVASPTSLAHLLEATGAPVLERTGSILSDRIETQGGDEEDRRG